MEYNECKELDGCVKININCCGKGDGSDGSGVYGKSAYEIAVENGFVGTEQEWLESLVGSDGGSIKLWCSGIFENRSLAANIHCPVTPVVQQGDSSLVNGYDFVVPEDGVYRLSVSTICGNASGLLWNTLWMNTFDFPALTSNVNRLAGVCNINADVFPNTSCERYFNAGDSITVALYSSVAQTTVKKDNIDPTFVFAKII